MEKNFLKLLSLQQELKKNEHFLSQDQRKQLAKYQSQILDHLRWERKNNFIEVMVDFQTKQINLEQYIDRFYEIDSEREVAQQKLISDFQKLEIFEPDVRSAGFAVLIENLLSDIRLLEADDSLRTPDEISPEELIRGIEEFLPKIEEY